MHVLLYLFLTVFYHCVKIVRNYAIIFINIYTCAPAEALMANAYKKKKSTYGNWQPWNSW